MKKLVFMLFVCFAVSSSITFGFSGSANHSVSSRDAFLNQNELKQKKDSVAKAGYTCPMHKEVMQDKPGKCPKCKMDLVAIPVYTCPMHKDVMLDKPGKCPKCKMNLVLKEPAGKPEPPKK